MKFNPVLKQESTGTIMDECIAAQKVIAQSYKIQETLKFPYL